MASVEKRETPRKEKAVTIQITVELRLMVTGSASAWRLAFGRSSGDGRSPARRARMVRLSAARLLP